MERRQSLQRAINNEKYPFSPGTLGRAKTISADNISHFLPAQTPSSKPLDFSVYSPSNRGVMWSRKHWFVGKI